METFSQKQPKQIESIIQAKVKLLDEYVRSVAERGFIAVYRGEGDKTELYRDSKTVNPHLTGTWYALDPQVAYDFYTASAGDCTIYALVVPRAMFDDLEDLFKNLYGGQINIINQDLLDSKIALAPERIEQDAAHLLPLTPEYYKSQFAWYRSYQELQKKERESD